MPKNWSTEERCRLYAAWIACQPSMKTNLGDIAALCDRTPSSVGHQLAKLKSEINALKEDSLVEVSVSPQKRKRDSKTSTPQKARKEDTKGTKKTRALNAKSKAKANNDSEAEEEHNSIDEQEYTPDLGDSNQSENETDSAISVQPETPTKVMPSRASKPKLGRFKEEPSPEIMEDE